MSAACRAELIPVRTVNGLPSPRAQRPSVSLVTGEGGIPPLPAWEPLAPADWRGRGRKRAWSTGVAHGDSRSEERAAPAGPSEVAQARRRRGCRRRASGGKAGGRGRGAGVVALS